MFIKAPLLRGIVAVALSAVIGLMIVPMGILLSLGIVSALHGTHHSSEDADRMWIMGIGGVATLLAVALMLTLPVVFYRKLGPASASKPILRTLDYRALGLSLMCYLVLAFAVAWLLPHAPGVVRPLLLLTVILPAIVLGIAAQRFALMHGILLGVLLFLIQTARIGLPHGPFTRGASALIVLVLMAGFCAFGAVLGQFTRNRILAARSR